MKNIYLFTALVIIGLALLALAHKIYLPIPGLLVAAILLLHWLHGAEMADHFGKTRPPYPFPGLKASCLLVAVSILAEWGGA